MEVAATGIAVAATAATTAGHVVPWKVVPSETDSKGEGKPAVLSQAVGKELFLAFLDGDQKSGRKLDGLSFPITGGHTVRFQLLSSDPPVALLHGYASNSEVADIMEDAMGLPWCKSVVGRDIGYVSPSRSSNSISTLPASALALWRRGHTLCGVSASSAPKDDEVDADLVRYHIGQEFLRHHDGKDRRFTIVLYLNALGTNDGGETEFPELALRVRPQKGMALVFRNTVKSQFQKRDVRAEHVARPVSATKYVLNVWISDSLFATD